MCVVLDLEVRIAFKARMAELIALTLSIGNMLVLASYDYSDRDEHTIQNQALAITHHTLTGLFGLEAALKIIALGLYAHPKGYLHNPWNILDLIIIFFGYLLSP